MWDDFCDWYLEIAKPRLYEGEAEASAILLRLLERTLALLHPLMPFVTEEIWSFHPARQGHLAVHSFPEADESLFDEQAEAEVERGIELTRRLRAWRDMVNLKPGDRVDLMVPLAGFPGRTVYHCHISEHGDKGMMAVLEVRAA